MNTIEIMKELETIDIVFLVQTGLCICISISLFLFIILHEKLRKKSSHVFALNHQLAHTVMCVMCVTNRLFSNFPRLTLSIALVMMFFSLVLLTVDRYLAVEYPYLYIRFNTYTRISVIIAICAWVLVLLIGSILFAMDLTPLDGIKIVTVVLLLVSMTLSVSNIKILMIAKEHARKDARVKFDVVPVSQMAHMRRYKATYVTFAIVFSFIILWFPVLVHQILFFMDRPNVLYSKIAIQISCINPVSDTILYILFTRGLRMEVIRIVCKLRKLYARKVGCVDCAHDGVRELSRRPRDNLYYYKTYRANSIVQHAC